MKWMIASDLHGSAYYCKKMVEAFEREGADRLLMLGDLLYHGPRNDLPREYAPKEVIPLLNGLGDRLLCVRGNCDSEVDQMILPFPMLADYALLSLDGVELFATHGHLHGPDAPPPIRSGSFLLCGHTHLPVRRAIEGFTYLNPGSLALPKEGTPHSCLVLENGIFTWRDVVSGVAFEPLS